MKYTTKEKIKSFFGKIAEYFLLSDEDGNDDNYFAYLFFILMMCLSWVISLHYIFKNNFIGNVFAAIFGFLISSLIQYLIIKIEIWLNDWKY
jgi:ABC-type multidrug transport system permease subunit